MSEFDYASVGGGVAGCVVTNRLTENPAILTRRAADCAKFLRRSLRHGIDGARREDHAQDHRSAAFNRDRGEEVAHGRHVQSDADIAEYVRQNCMTMYHPTSTCRMGTDPMAVVSPSSLLVQGLENLSIVDASVMPAVTSGNTFTPTVAMAEKAADLIKARGR